MKKFIPIIAILAITLSSCGVKRTVGVVRYETPTNEQVQVLGSGQTVPSDAVLIGSVNIGDTGFTSSRRCTYAVVIKEAIVQAQAMGGNILHIKSHKEPDAWSTCHRITSDVYKLKNNSNY